MSRGSYPIIIAACHVLAGRRPGHWTRRNTCGLGPQRTLQAQIDIVGATRDDLAVLTANDRQSGSVPALWRRSPVIPRLRHFKVGLNAQGRPVLNVRSAEAFTDPVVSFLVDLHWGNGELIREYSLLLDPASLAQARAAPRMGDKPSRRLRRASPGASLPATRRIRAAGDRHRPQQRASGDAHQAAGTPPDDGAITGAHSASSRPLATPCVSIARRAGARTEPQAQRLMMAIFRANPEAFDGNINLLHLGAVLNIPSEQAVAAIDGVEAARKCARK
jgi:pilus assembly protein FimV